MKSKLLSAAAGLMFAYTIENLVAQLNPPSRKISRNKAHLLALQPGIRSRPLFVQSGTGRCNSLHFGGPQLSTCCSL